MANRTIKDAKSIHGTNPQYLIEKIIRSRIYESKYWKEQCFALSAELLVDKAMELRAVGGVYAGNIKPCSFLCLILKMLQIQPDIDIVVEFISNQDFKYVRALGAFYMRLTGTSIDCYKYLEPLYLDYRKLRMLNRDGSYVILHMDEYIDQLLREERVFDVILPRIQTRGILEENNQLEPRVNALDEDMDMEDDDDDEDEEMAEPGQVKDDRREDRKKRSRSRSPRRDRDRERRREKDRERDKDRERERDKDKEHRDKDRDRHEKDRHRHRSRSRERDRHRDEDRKREERREERHRERDRDREKRKSSRERDHHRHHDDEETRHKHKKSKKDKRSREDAEDKDIREQNELRAKLGLAPLK